MDRRLLTRTSFQARSLLTSGIWHQIKRLLTRSLSRLETQDIKTQPQFNHYISLKGTPASFLFLFGNESVLALGIPINSEWIYLRSEPSTLMMSAGTFVGVSLSFFHIFDATSEIAFGIPVD